MKKKTFICRMVALMAAMMCALGAKAQEAYACYTPENTTFTFFYDNQRDSRTGTTYDLNEVDNNPGWYTEGTNVNVTQVIFDPSFADARPTNTTGWFYKMESLQSITGMQYLNTSEVTDMAWMFGYCKSLTRLDVSHFNTSKVTCMTGMFNYCKELTRLDLSSFNTSKVTEMEDMFSTCINLQTIDVGSGWDTNAVVSSASMFYLCHSLVGGQGTTWDQENSDDKTYAHIDGGPNNPGYFTEMVLEAYACYTSSNTTFTFYYDNQRSIRPGTTYSLVRNEPSPYPLWSYDHLDVTKVVFDPSFAKYRPTSTYYWFGGMHNLEAIEGMKYLNTSEVTEMCYMFVYCRRLTSLDLSGFNTANVDNMYSMFSECNNLTRLDLGSFNTAKVINFRSMFQDCYNLKTIYVGDEWSLASMLYADNVFIGCNSLVGGQGTTYDGVHLDGDYAHIDGGPSNPGYLSKRPAFTRGDVDDDLDITISDVTALNDYLLNGDASVINPVAADCDQDGNISFNDVTVLVDYLLSGNWPEPVYTVVGTANLFESEWNLNDERNNMIKGDDGIYRLNKAGWFPQGTEIYFRIVTNHSYAFSWPAEDRIIYIYETGAFSIDIIFDPNAPDDQKINIDMNQIF